MANAKVKSILSNKILKIKNNLSEPVETICILNSDAFLDVETGPEEFHDYYQNLALTREEQEQCLKQLNTQLCDHCLILCNFQYCNKCDIIYNLPPYIIYTILEKEKPISSCVSELESTFYPDSNSNNNDNKNNDSSSIQNNNNNNNSLNSNSNPEQYIVFFNLTKKQKLK
ncbi:hypothetical protein G9A89_011481 [Geosiphon pyriformis]|nr:hypothetical protein G9A89_011481 [Geosiphon pyriformis]